ncbi:SGNH/GDSL hydrolase family protein [Brevibacillus sp. H7]|uniref:SGNH/GDSL hydrolase family protein n=1 Tax=Brevibacillus sp. H7 TaxID=3349138 RepID=UPI0037F5E82F
MNHERTEIIRPGFFSIEAAADRRRNEFDYHNEAILHHRVPVDFVFFGDSITHWWDLQTYFGRTGKFIVNRGIGGDTTEFARKRFAADVLQLKPKHLVMKIGINNTWALDEWRVEDRKTADQIYQEIVQDTEAMLHASMGQGISTILCSLLPTCMDRYAQNHARNLLVVKTNEALKQLAEETGAIYVDYHSRMVETDGVTLRAELADDGLHPHVLGYNIMAEVLRQELCRHGIEI